MKRIWVICGGPSSEFEVSLSSAQVVCEQMDLSDKTARPVIMTRSGEWIISEKILSSGNGREWLGQYFADGRAGKTIGVDIAQAFAAMRREQVDCVFLALHGEFVEDGRLQGFLDTARIPYTGSGVLASAVAFNKSLTIAVYRLAGLMTPNGVRVTSDGSGVEAVAGLRPPLFVKPVSGGSSVGMTLVHDLGNLSEALEKAFTVDTVALVEERVVGTEISCGVVDLIENGSVTSRALPPTELRPVGSEFFDYEAKYVEGKCREITPAELPDEVIARIQACALQAHEILGCEGMSRTDMIIPPAGNREPVLLETNTIPGMTPTSILPQQCAGIGISFPQFIDLLITHALFRQAASAGALAAGP